MTNERRTAIRIGGIDVPEAILGLEVRVAFLERVIKWMAKDSGLPARLTKTQGEALEREAVEFVRKKYPGLEFDWTHPGRNI